MKQKVLMMVLALGMLCINVSAQTKKQSTAKRTTTTRSTNSQQGGQVMKFKQVGEDGYVWYKLKRGSLCGARDAEGNNIIPIKYDDVAYICAIEKYAHNDGSYERDRQDGKHYFNVTKGKAKGVYTREGRLVISTDKNYGSIYLEISYIKPCWVISTQNSEFRNGILDMKGNIVIQPGKYKVARPFYCGLIVTDYSDKEGICDWNGKIVIPCQYESCWVEYKDGKYKLTYRESKNAEWKSKTISFNTSSKFDYQTYDNLCYNYNAPSSNSSSSSSSSSSTKKEEEKKVEVVVKQQQWIPCEDCGGTGKCKYCQDGWVNFGYEWERCWVCMGLKGVCTICRGRRGYYK